MSREIIPFFLEAAEVSVSKEDVCIKLAGAAGLTVSGSQRSAVGDGEEAIFNGTLPLLPHFPDPIALLVEVPVPLCSMLLVSLRLM